MWGKEHRRKLTIKKAGFQVLKSPMDRMRLVLLIARKPIAE
ncbi:conserved domain protein [Bacteroides clarus YIT 12056]|uniref:Conserved domain protein n=1 Tax=Bacteroides clarus YIT 12056 TaxID=762984 RepID=A0ABP2KUK6_9BACE|nr:conserved domain protein [Bacteroides clarus YIT 12056]